MDDLLAVDWRAIFVPRHSLLDLVVRGTLVYLSVFAMMRLVLRRQTGGIGMTDVLVVVLIAEVAGSGVAPEAQSVVEGVVLVATLLFWSHLIEWLSWRFPAFERLVRDPKLQLVADGRMLLRNMRRELVTTEELKARIREDGLEDCSLVKAAYLEADGTISIIRRNDGSSESAPPPSCP